MLIILFLFFYIDIIIITIIFIIIIIIIIIITLPSELIRVTSIPSLIENLMFSLLAQTIILSLSLLEQKQHTPLRK